MELFRHLCGQITGIRHGWLEKSILTHIPAKSIHCYTTDMRRDVSVCDVSKSFILVQYLAGELLALLWHWAWKVVIDFVKHVCSSMWITEVAILQFTIERSAFKLRLSIDHLSYSVKCLASSSILICRLFVPACLPWIKTWLTVPPVPRRNSWRLTRAVEREMEGSAQEWWLQEGCQPLTYRPD